MDIKDGLLGKVPIVTLLVAFVMTATFMTAQFAGVDEDGEYEELLLRAQVFYERNAGIELDARGRSLLGSEFVNRVEIEHAGQGEKPKFSKRMRARTQSKFDAVVEDALFARMVEDPAWSEGINGPGVPATRYLTYAFFHASWLAFGVTLAFLLIAGLGLEASWGALVHAPFVLLSIVVGGLVFAQADAAGQVPLTGAGPLVASLLAAYVVRGFGGNLPLPGLLLLPIWVFVDALFVRGIWTDNLGDWPVATLGLSMVLGAGLSLGVRVMGVESKLVDSVDSMVDGVHPALEAADRLRSLGRPADVYGTLVAAVAEEPGNNELALALWDAALEIGLAEEVAPMMMPILQAELRAGDLENATTHWRQVMASGAVVEASTTLMVRMGEALLDASEPEQALDTLRRALDAPGRMGSALAQRVVRIARDLDPVLTARAATVALEDDQIDPGTRDDLDSLAGGAAAAAANWRQPPSPAATTGVGLGDEPTVAPAPTAAAARDDASVDALLAGGADRAGAATPGAIGLDDIDAGLGQSDDGLGDDLDVGDGLDHGEIDLSHVGDLASAEDFADLDADGGLPSMGADHAAGAAGAAPEVETDPNALSIQSIEREFASGLETDAAPSADAGDDPSTWNQVGVIEDLSGELDSDGPALMGAADLDAVPVADDGYLDPDALNLDALSAEPADLGIDDSPLDAGDLGTAPVAAPAAAAPGLVRQGDFTNDPTDPMAPPDLLAGDSTDALTPLEGDSTDALPPLGAAPAGAGSTAPQALQTLADNDATASQPLRTVTEPPAAPLPSPAAQPAPPTAPPVSAAQPARPAAAPAPPVAPPAAVVPVTPAGEASTRVDELGMAGAGSAQRTLKVLDAVPMALEAEALKFDVEGRGKTRLPFERIDAVAIAAVGGLTAKPVLVIDFVLNWGGAPSETLKVIRVRSDRFNPATLVGVVGGSPLDAIKTIVRRVLDGAGATPLPDAGAVMGSPFSQHADLASYEHEVLQAG